MSQQYQQPGVMQRFSKYFLQTAQGILNNLIMDMALPAGGVNNDNLFGAQGTGTTNASAGTTQAITHGLGVVPLVSDIVLTPEGTGMLWLDPANVPSSTTFNVLSSATSQAFAWKIVTNGPGNS